LPVDATPTSKLSAICRGNCNADITPCIFRELPEHGTGYIPDPRLLEEIVRWLDSLDRF
jgi:hypothetical protein